MSTTVEPTALQENFACSLVPILLEIVVVSPRLQISSYLFAISSWYTHSVPVCLSAATIGGTSLRMFLC